MLNAKRSEAVKQYNSEGEEIMTYPSIQYASRETGIRASSISRVCNGSEGCVKAGGFLWSF